MAKNPRLSVQAAEPPTSQWSPPEEIVIIVGQVLQWSAYIGIFIAVCALIVMAAMMAIDKNRGEAGIASTDHSRALRLAMGIAFIMVAPQTIRWFLAVFPS